jgi:hypothetical protein
MSRRSVAAEVAQLPTLPVEELIARYADVFGHEPAIQRKTWLWRRIAWRIQADARGGLSAKAKKRLSDLCGHLPEPTPVDGAVAPRRAQRVVKGIRRAHGLVPGQILEREYKGAAVRVKVLEEGVEHEGVVYASLSAVAKHVTGSAWNGRLFFGLTERSRRR